MRMTKDVTPRRVPQQARGARRVTAILDAAAALFAEVGYDAATTNHIAARAGASIASLYQFFPNKEAIAKALADRYLDGLRTIYGAMFAPTVATLPRRALVDHLLDPLVAYTRSQVGFRVLFSGTPASAELAATVNALDQEVVYQLEAMFAVRAPDLDPDLRARRAAVSVQTVKALLPLIIAADEPHAATLVAELKLLLAAYFRDGIDDQAS